MDDRLIHLEGQLAQVLACMKSQSQLDPGQRSSSSTSLSDYNTNTIDGSSSSASSVGTDDRVERYDGPKSLDWLCQDFKAAILTRNQSDSSTTKETNANRSIGGLLERICGRPGGDLTQLPQSGGSIPQLPPKDQFLKAQEIYFQQVGHATDIFVQANVLETAEALYSCPLQPLDEAWSITLRGMVLLAAGSEIQKAQGASLFGTLAGSFLLPSAATLLSPNLLTARRLVNVQALILLSVLAEQQNSPEWSEILFANACTLARAIEVHRSQGPISYADSTERQERWRVFRSLYIRDKRYAVVHGHSSWLSDADHPSLLTPPDDPEALVYRSRVELASLQNEVYNLASGPNAGNRHSKRAASRIKGLQESLDAYALAHNIFGNDGKMADQIALQMDFLGTRIAALRDSPYDVHQKSALADARASCLLLIMVCGSCEQTMLRKYDAVLILHLGVGIEDPSAGQCKDKTDLLASSNATELFPPSAFFLLAHHVLWPTHADEYDAQDDATLLDGVVACYSDKTAPVPAGSQSHKSKAVFEALVQTIGAVQEERQASRPSSSPSALALQPEILQQDLAAPPPISEPMPQSNHGLPGSTTADWPTPNSFQELLCWDNFPDFPNHVVDPTTMLLPSQTSLSTTNDDTATDIFENLIAAADSGSAVEAALPSASSSGEDKSGRKRRRTNQEPFSPNAMSAAASSPDKPMSRGE
ncbi:hypothetical protein LTR86_009848 [Recurvomyces mirabilis]|nr:hypothetical protein LTR86_009848 [Recurvomyces mirabilis]